jgi:hypothetical protein
VVRLGCWWTFFGRALWWFDMGQAGWETRGGTRDAMEARSRMVGFGTISESVCTVLYSRHHQ